MHNKYRRVGTNPTLLLVKGGDKLANIEERVKKLIKGKIEDLGYELYDVEYVKEGKNYFLRVYIDKKDGIDLNDCEKVNDGINELLDEADYIKEQYFLEVSSPGTSTAICVNQESLAAPCQCLTPALILTTSPGCNSLASFPHS